MPAWRLPALRFLTGSLGLLTVLLVGCDLASTARTPVPRELDELTTDCEPPFAFQGDGSIAELGLGQDMQELGAKLEERGVIRITRDKVRHEEFLPPGVPVTVDEGQLLCMTFADGTGMTLMLPVPFPDVPASGGTGFNWAPIMLGAVVVVAVGISAAAFRQHPAR